MAVKTTGQFDSDFMKLMIPHHEAALEMAKAELLCGKYPAARRLAQEIIADQTSEIDLMKLLLKHGSANHNNTPAPAAQESIHEAVPHRPAVLYRNSCGRTGATEWSSYLQP